VSPRVLCHREQGAEQFGDLERVFDDWREMAFNDDTEEYEWVAYISSINNRTERMAVRVIEHADALRDALIAVDTRVGKWSHDLVGTTWPGNE